MWLCGVINGFISYQQICPMLKAAGQEKNKAQETSVDILIFLYIMKYKNILENE